MKFIIHFPCALIFLSLGTLENLGSKSIKLFVREQFGKSGKHNRSQPAEVYTLSHIDVPKRVYFFISRTVDEINSIDHVNQSRLNPVK